MNRLTEWTGERWIANQLKIGIGDKAIYAKLAAYEDTGLEPEEVYKTIKAGVPEWIPKYLEYRNLEEQGLLIKLPCKVGDTVYFIRNKKLQIFEIDTIKVRKQISIHGYYHSTGRRWGTPHEITIGKNTIGKKLFLTREEAEKALEAPDAKA